VARRIERERARTGERLDSEMDPPGDDPSLTEAFDRAWARALVRQAGERQHALAREIGPEARRRVALLRLRFEEGLPIREIARRWDEEPARLHHESAKARREFHAALTEVLREQHVDGDLDTACSRLLDSLR
jgi:RNA polymerase sigma-70 factor (ECF subfamily)